MVDRLPDITRALVLGGVPFVQHHLRSANPVEAGSGDDRFRFSSNGLPRACLDLTVLYYDERTEVQENSRSGAVVRLIARNSTGDTQSYPRVSLDGTENTP